MTNSVNNNNKHDLKKAGSPQSPDQSARVTKRLSNKERLRSFLQIFKRDDRVLVIIVADPDAMASAKVAKAIRVLLEEDKEPGVTTYVAGAGATLADMMIFAE